MLLALLCAALAGQVQAVSLPGLGELAGQVRGGAPDSLAIVSARNRQRDVAYIVYVVNGRYRAVNLFPGDYDVTVRPAVGQLKSFKPVTRILTVPAGGRARADFALGPVAVAPNYVGGMPYDSDPKYPDGEIQPYDIVYPPGPGRVILERTCNACHAVNFISYNVPRAYPGGRGPKNRDAWAASVDRMHKGPAFGRDGKAPVFDPALLPPADRVTLIDYLAANFGAKSEPRVVQLTSVPPLDRKALSRAMFIEYNYREPKGKYDVHPWPHQVDFDKEGNVWLAYTACCIVRLDPRTGESKAFEGWGGGHGIAVDQTDGTIWYSGDAVRRLDPASGKVDRWKIGNDPLLSSNTQIFDSQGNLWLSFLGAGALGKWDRQSDSMQWWEVPVLASRPYGIIVDNFDKVWFADYHNGGVTRFDPVTERFRHYPMVREQTASSIRRLGVDSKNNIWAGTWASVNYIAKLYRLNPETGEIKERALTELPHAATYNAEPDSHDNIWLSNDNYLSKYDPDADRFTHYPIPMRSDTLKTTITRDDGVWFFYRNAGKTLGYGGTAVVLYPDKDQIPTLGAYHSANNQGHRLARFKGPLAPPVHGEERIAPSVARNASAYRDWALAQGLLRDLPSAAAITSRAAPEAWVVATGAPQDSAQVAEGRKVYQAICIACHTVQKGAAHGVGPNLWGVIGKKAAGQADYSYSKALRESQLTWDQTTLLRFVAAPAQAVPGTSMASIGVTSTADQIALLAFLRDAAVQVAGENTQQDIGSQRE